MKKYVFVALTNAKDGCDDEFNALYSTMHVADALKIKGFVAAQRFRLTADQRRGPPYPWQYMAVYDMETDDLPTVMAELTARVGTQSMPLSDAISPELLSFVFEPITEKATAAVTDDEA